MRALRQHDGEHDDRQHDVHQRPHDQDLEPLPLRLRQELVRLAGARVVGVLAGHLHVAAEGNCADAVLGIAAGEFQDLGAETKRKGQHAHADAAGGEEVSQLVNEDKDTQDKEECEKSGHYTVNSSARASSSACWRAQRSTRRTVSIVDIGSAWCASMVFLMTRGMAVKPSLPSRKASTATSLAAFSTTGSVPPARSARYASARHGKRSCAGS